MSVVLSVSKDEIGYGFVCDLDPDEILVIITSLYHIGIKMLDDNNEPTAEFKRAMRDIVRSKDQNISHELN